MEGIPQGWKYENNPTILRGQMFLGHLSCNALVLSLLYKLWNYCFQDTLWKSVELTYNQEANFLGGISISLE